MKEPNRCGIITDMKEKNKNYLPYKLKIKQKSQEHIWLQALFGGSGWIRTTEATCNRFTVCPLWPLGNAPKYNAAAHCGMWSW